VSLAKGRPQTNQKPAGQNGRQNGGQTQANLTEDSEVFCAVTVEANLVTNTTEWILHNGATRHFCTNKDLMHDLKISLMANMSSWQCHYGRSVG